MLVLASSVKSPSVDGIDVEDSLAKSVAEVLVCVASVPRSDNVANSTVNTVLSVGKTVVEDVVVELLSPISELSVSLEEVKSKKSTVVTPRVDVFSFAEAIVVSLPESVGIFVEGLLLPI